VKDPTGTVRVFHNVCRHRGRQLVDEACELQGSIRCPYHSWTYHFDGSLSCTPNIGGHGIHDLKDFDPALHGLFQVRSAVWMDMLFVNLSGDAPSFDKHIAPLEARWSKFTGAGDLSCARPVNDGGWMEMEARANWKLLVENYCESYHLPWVHPGLNSYSKIEDHYTILAGDWGAGQGTTVFDFSERAGIDLPVFAKWPEAEKKVAEYIALFPNVLLGLQASHFYAVDLLPVAVDQTVEQFQIYYVGDETLTERYAKARRILLAGWREVFVEDFDPVEGMQRGRASSAFDGGAFSPVLDTGTHHFHKWVAARLADN
ncbi:MAG: Rieske 2Fe-2S domain-containing protein, partial [Methylococcales bacterium]|nr:Rieske 2Fe-2S domain-containing protein [Methylococcales bacterium]